MAQYHSGALRIAIEKCGSEAAARTALLHLAEQHPRLVAQTTRETPLPSGIDISAFAEMK
jgi:sirohydrochlorin ferrochelatase